MYYQIVLVFADGQKVHVPYAGSQPYQYANEQIQKTGCVDAYAEEIEMDDYKKMVRKKNGASYC